MDEPTIRDLLTRYGRALSTGDLDGVADAWEVPALVLSDEGARAVGELAEVRAFFAQAIDWYRQRGQIETRPKLEAIERLSDALAAVKVRWLAYDAGGAQVSSERSFYVVRRGADGRPRISVAAGLSEA